MASYELVFKKSVAKELRALPKHEIKRILQRISSLAENPRQVGCEKLSGQERYRWRQGRYRIIYEIDDSCVRVLIVKVAHRREVYRAD